MASRGRWLSKVWALVALVAVAAVGVVVPANATSMFWLGGTSGTLGRLVPPGTFGTFDDLLGGVYKDARTTTIDYPGSVWPVTGLLDPTLGRSVRTGTTMLETAVGNFKGGPLVIIGTSQGAMAVQQAEADLNDDPSVPSSTTFILIADPNFGIFHSLHGVYLPILDYRPVAFPETRFNTTVVINQYDGFADPIARPWNLLTDLNALMGVVYVHPFAQNTDLSLVPAEDITVTKNDQNGTTTVYHVPTENLPLTMPLRQLGVSDTFVDGIDAVLRPLIDRGYEDPCSNPGSSKRPNSAARLAAAAPRETISASAPASASSVRASAAAVGQSKAAGTSGRGAHRQRAAAH